ncbi:MAG TPA: glycosyl hydrolase, partial [Nevskiaceae bacterium]|nr:glycosyl hydrolase [Nevskiaceae bacterium]
MSRRTAALLLAGCALGAGSAHAGPTLEQQFAQPGASARPRVWWHWIDGNVTREGITRDLEWMQRSGIAGFQMFDVGRGFPALVEEPAPYLSPHWKDLLHHAASEADRLHLEM